MADIKYYDVILKPVITESSMEGMDYKKYTFYVNTEATKTMIKDAGKVDITSGLNVYDILKYDKLVIEKAAVQAIEEVYA